MGILLPNKPQKEKEESDFDKVLKGLSVARDLVGIPTEFAKIDQMKADAEQRKADSAMKMESTERERAKFKLDEDRAKREQEKFEAEKASGFGIEEKRMDAHIKRQTAKKNERDLSNPLSQDKVLRVSEGEAIPTTLADIQATLNKNKDAFGPVKGRVSSFNPYDTKAATIDAQFRAGSQQFGRFMEGGVLRKEDEDKYRKMFPQLSDTPEVAANKLAIVNRLMTQKQQADVKALGDTGYDVSAFKNTKPVGALPDVLTGKAPQAPEGAVAGMVPQSPATKDPQIENYAKQHGLDYGKAENILRARGYGQKPK